MNMDQLEGLIQLFNYNTNDGIKIGSSSSYRTIIIDPMTEINSKPVPRAVIGLLSDIPSRK
ncbi:MAG: hypothetical protein ACFFD2_04460 [Promethearchaeota archaeon]